MPVTNADHERTPTDLLYHQRDRLEMIPGRRAPWRLFSHPHHPSYTGEADA